MNAVTTFEHAAAVPQQRRGSQATAVEQSRAVAEVQASFVVAQQRPRDKAAAMAEMREVTGMTELAVRAFFSFNRGGQVHGASIHLARELARCWGNINYGVMELSRDDIAGQSEMLAFACDLQTNTRRATSFIVPHVRDTKNGSRQLTDMRDIYENNANNGARRLRECIFSVLPVWFVEEAKARCTQTVKDGGGVPLIKRIADTIDAYGKIGVTKAQLERRQGRQSDQWTADDYASLRVLYGTIQNGETSVGDEFEKDAVELPANADGFEQAAAGAKPNAQQKPEPQRQAKPQDSGAAVGGQAGPQVSPGATGPAAGQRADDDWSALDADGWLAQVYAVSDIIDACTTAKALSVIQAAPKFAGPYAAMKRHAPKSAQAVDDLVAKRREALSNG